jgi:transposase-like protein
MNEDDGGERHRRYRHGTGITRQTLGKWNRAAGRGKAALHYDQEFKEEVLRMLAEHDPIATVKAFGVTGRTLYMWKQHIAEKDNNNEI